MWEKDLFVNSGSHDQDGHHAHKTPLKIFFTETEWPMTLKLGMRRWLRPYQIYSNEDLAWSNWSLGLLYGIKIKASC